MSTDEYSKAGQASGDREALRKLAVKSGETFAIPPDRESLFSSLTESMCRVRKPFIEIGDALQSNISGLISTVTIPFTLADRSATDRHWQRIYAAARIRSLKLLAEPSETMKELELRRDRVALERATSEMNDFAHSPEGGDAFIRDTLGFLETFRSDEAVIGAANELILQGLVLCWGAFEALARDCFVAHLNAKPACTLALLEDPVAKRRFELSKVSLETLATHSFDLSQRMGTLLAQQQDLSDVYSVKSVYRALFPDDAGLASALSDPNLRLLSLRRNLIVHQCGIVDDQYVAATNHSQQVGERLRISPDDLEAHLGTTVKVAACILDAVSAAA